MLNLYKKINQQLNKLPNWLVGKSNHPLLWLLFGGVVIGSIAGLFTYTSVWYFPGSVYKIISSSIGYVISITYIFIIYSNFKKFKNKVRKANESSWFTSPIGIHVSILIICFVLYYFNYVFTILFLPNHFDKYAKTQKIIEKQVKGKSRGGKAGCRYGLRFTKKFDMRDDYCINEVMFNSVKIGDKIKIFGRSNILGFYGDSLFLLE